MKTHFDTLIVGGTLVDASGETRADLAIRGEQIAAVGTRLRPFAGADTRILDARGRLVIPGLVDGHVHFALPAGGIRSHDDFASGTLAAACGGVTTVIDFVTPAADETLHHALDARRAEADGRACTDYGLHMSITDWDRQHKEIPRIVGAGNPTFKLYMTYEEAGLYADDAVLYETLRTLRPLGGTVLVHAEANEILRLFRARYHTRTQMKAQGARLHARSRPHVAEVEAIERAIRWTAETGARLYVVHVSTAEGADLIRAARHRGVDVSGETCPHFLALDERVFDRPDGHLYATAPQVKTPADQTRLWDALRNDDLSTIATDHCNFSRKQKDRWRGDFTRIPMGLPGVETLLPLVYSLGVRKRRLSMSQLVSRCCTTPARIMGLYPRKGTLQVGGDADLAIIDPRSERELDHAALRTDCDWSPYQGWKLRGFPEHVFSRGTQLVSDYAFIGPRGHGQYLVRQPR